jgi:hypothetical protein
MLLLGLFPPAPAAAVSVSARPLPPGVSAPVTAGSMGDLPAVTVTDGSLTAVPGNIYTRFEYALIPDKPPAGFTPKWLPLGSAYERGGTALTASFLPSCFPYSVCVRIEGDNKPGFLDTRTSGIPVTAPRVLASLEKLGPLDGGTGGLTWYFTTNGGKKWVTVTVKAGEEAFIDLAKVFGKNETAFQLRRATLSAGIPTLPDEAPVALEGTLKPRPVFPKELALSAFVSEQYPENWTLTGSSAALEYSAPGTVWVPFQADVGLPLLTVAEQALKIKATPYQIRVAASESDGTPASPAKKYAQPKQVKAPNAKPDYKKEVIKLKTGLKYRFGEAELTPDAAAFETASGDPVSIEGAISGGQVIYVYAPENGKKSRSVVQAVALAERGDSPDEGEGLVLNKNSASLQKGFEFYGSKDKWGSFIKGDESGLIRRKPTAKYNAKTNTNAGFAASIPVRCEIKYTEDGKSVTAVEMERKQSIPLQSWGISSLSGGSYSFYADPVADTKIELNTSNGAVSFFIYPDFSFADAGLIASSAVALNGQELTAQNGAYYLNGLKAGDVVTLTAIPKDRNTYRKTAASITIVRPREAAPAGVSFGYAGAYGDVTVTLANPALYGSTRTLHVDLVRMPEGKIVHQDKTAVAYSSAVFYDRVTFDFKKALMDAGPGSYELRAYFGGTSATSDSPPVTASWTFAAEDFGVRFIDVSAPNPLNVGDKISVERLTDGFGNELKGSAFQWYRVSGSTRYVITQDGTGAVYTLTPADAWCYMEVLIYCNGIYFSHTVNRRVEAW